MIMEQLHCVLVLAAVVLTGVTRGQMSRGPTLPLIPDSREPDIQHSKPGCWLGGNFYNFQERWSPALLPQGVMHCVKCQCLAVEKKGVLQTRGKVKCKNIKGDCPKPLCDQPVLHPDRCCKTCPGDENDFEANFSFQSLTNLAPSYSGDHNHLDTGPSDFVAVLVGSGVRGQHVRTDAVAVVYLSVQGGELRFAVRHTRLRRPKLLQIVDANGNVVFKQPIQKRRRPDKKLCGLWAKIPDVYTRYLRQERLFAVITTSRHQRGHVAGKIVVNNMAGKDTFQAVLSPDSDSGVGGAASLTFDSRRQTLHYVITLNGVLDDSPARSEYFVTIEKSTKIVHKSRGRLDQQVTTVTGSWQLSRKRQAKQLGRGRLRLRVTSIRGTTVSGKIEPRLTCGVFQAVLTAGRKKRKTRTPGSGSVVLQLSERGRLDYKVRLSGMDSAVTGISLEVATGRKRRRHVVSSLTESFRPDSGSVDGWANGTVKRLKADDIAALLGDELMLHVHTRHKKKSALKGRLTETPYRKFMDSGHAFPFTLNPLVTSGQSLNAHAWLWLEAGCALRYDVIVAGMRRRKHDFHLLLGSRGNDLQPSGIRDSALQTSTDQNGVSVISGTYSDLSQDLFRDLDLGRAFLQVNAGDDASSIIVGNVTVRNTCWQYVHDSEDTDMLVDVTQDEDVEGEREEGEDGEGPEPTWPRLKCYYEGRFYSNGESWLPIVNASCNTCSCINGKPQCHAVVCPPLSCANPLTPPGECCPVCPGTEEGPACHLSGDPRSYPLGRSWHPFLPLKGFSVCVNCTCMAGGVPRCERLPCPTLTCPEHLRVRRHPDDCCQVCVEEGEAEANDYDTETKPLMDVDMHGACTFVDRTYPNGSSWHPHVRPFGVMRCIVCSCKDGSYRCGKRRCPAKCRRKRRRRNPCCEPCTPGGKGKADEKSVPENMDCEFGGKTYKENEKWRPPASPFGSGKCAVCKCKKGRAKCKLRCPSRCSRPGATSNMCCRQCAARQESSRRRGRSTASVETSTQTTQSKAT